MPASVGVTRPPGPLLTTFQKSFLVRGPRRLRAQLTCTRRGGGGVMGLTPAAPSARPRSPRRAGPGRGPLAPPAWPWGAQAAGKAGRAGRGGMAGRHGRPRSRPAPCPRPCPGRPPAPVWFGKATPHSLWVELWAAGPLGGTPRPPLWGLGSEQVPRPAPSVRPCVSLLRAPGRQRGRMGVTLRSGPGGGGARSLRGPGSRLALPMKRGPSHGRVPPGGAGGTAQLGFGRGRGKPPEAVVRQPSLRWAPPWVPRPPLAWGSGGGGGQGARQPGARGLSAWPVQAPRSVLQ